MTSSRHDLLGEHAWARLRPGVVRRLRRYLQNIPESTIEDTVQEVMAGLHVFIMRNGLPDDLEAIVTTISRRKAASALRREIAERGRFVREATVAENIPDPGFDIEIELVRDECTRAAHAVLACFRRNKAPCESIAQGRMRGLEFEAIAESLGMQVAAVRQAWHRCIIRLKESIRRGDVDVLGYDGSPRELP